MQVDHQLVVVSQVAQILLVECAVELLEHSQDAHDQVGTVHGSHVLLVLDLAEGQKVGIELQRLQRTNREQSHKERHIGEGSRQVVDLVHGVDDADRLQTHSKLAEHQLQFFIDFLVREDTLLALLCSLFVGLACVGLKLLQIVEHCGVES